MGGEHEANCRQAEATMRLRASRERLLHSRCPQVVAQNPKGQMTTQQNCAQVNSFIEQGINQGHLDSIAKYVWEDVVEQVPFPGQGPGLEGMTDVLRGMRTAESPDCNSRGWASGDA
jgi:hypothetical protein